MTAAFAQLRGRRVPRVRIGGLRALALHARTHHNHGAAVVQARYQGEHTALRQQALPTQLVDAGFHTNFGGNAQNQRVTGLLRPQSMLRYQAFRTDLQPVVLRDGSQTLNEGMREFFQLLQTGLIVGRSPCNATARRESIMHRPAHGKISRPEERCSSRTWNQAWGTWRLPSRVNRAHPRTVR